MAYKVLVVDDSSFFRRRLSDILSKETELDVIDVAVNGLDAVKKAIALKPDVITMDIEMPELDGIEAVKQIMAKAPTSILMFSSLTHKGAKATLNALEAGALDFLPKKFNEIAANSDDAGKLLRERVLQLARKKGFKPTSLRSRPATITPATPKYQRAAVEPYSRSITRNKKYKLLAIGTSTGGPVALQTVLTKLPKDFPLPILLIQHMPAAFTPAFATRLDGLCQINVKEAETGDILKPGCAYLAPGGCQMIIDGTISAPKIKILEDNSTKITYKPSVDISFGSAAKIYNGDVLAVILTGMGADGREGARMLKGKGATIWAQDEESSIVYGMPQAVTLAGLSDLSLPLNDVGHRLIKEVTNG